MESGLTRRAGRCIDPGDHRYISRVAEAVEIRRVSEPGMGPSPPCATELPPIGWKPSIVLLQGWGAAVELEPISNSSQWNWGFHTVGSGVDPRHLGFLPPFV